MADPISIFLSLAADKFFNALISKITGKAADDIWDKLHGSSVKQAFKQSLGLAIQRYANTGTRLSLAVPLLQHDGVLTNDLVAEELSQLLRFERKPNAQLIGDLWGASLNDIPPWRDMAYETELLLKYLEDELRASDVFYRIFEVKDIRQINSYASSSAETLETIEAHLSNLVELVNGHFGTLATLLANTSPQVSRQVCNYSSYIQEKSQDFTGRQFIFDAIDRFLNSNPRGYFFIRGDPGIGKTAIAAQLVKSRGYIHHFNIRAEGINKTSLFIRNICAQLIAVYQLNYPSVPENAVHDSEFLKQLLYEVSSQLSPSDEVVIVVDALDEVDVDEIKPGANILYLPVSLPKGIYFVITLRKQMINVRSDCEVGILDIEQDSANNVADIRQYLDQSMSRSGIQQFVASQKISRKQFVDHLADKSQGNFMYLHYVLPEIEKGAYKDLNPGNLPAGLQNYYEDHWRRMRGEDEESWFKYKLPIIMALTVVKKPVSISLLSDFSGVKEFPRIRSVLEHWSQFLYEERVEHDGQSQKRYRIYHASFHEFIEKKEDIADERVSRQRAHRNITNNMWEDLFGNGIPE